MGEANYLVDNGIIDKLGQADFSKEWDWGEVAEQMALAFVSAGISQGGSTVIETNSAIQAAEEQLGRKLTPEEKALVTQASLEGALENKVAELEQRVTQQTTQEVQVQPTKTVEQLDNEIVGKIKFGAIKTKESFLKRIKNRGCIFNHKFYRMSRM